MADPVNAKRRYNSPRRLQQAAATRWEILKAAQRLFAEQGYAATTMSSIAAEAGVALKTVYKAFQTKSGVVRALWNLQLRGDENSAPIAERDWYREVLEEPDPERQLRLNARNSRAAKLRIGDVIEVIHGAAPLDPDIDALWNRIQTEFHANQHKIAKSLGNKHALRANLDINRAADILWTLNHPDVWQLLVRQRGWTPEQYEHWFADAACSQLLTPADRRIHQAPQES
jgi:AcrR family transcriptional regulator